MKKTIYIILIILAAAVSAACFLVPEDTLPRDNPVDPGNPITFKDITSYGFTSEAHSELSSDVTGTIDGTDITVAVPYSTDVTALVASFTTNSDSVTVGGSEQVSGTTPNDFTTPVTYRVIADDSSYQDYTVTVTTGVAGDKDLYSAGGVSFIMAYVPGGLTFPTGIDDVGNATVDDAYWIAETEVTYELWYKVHGWALLNGYTFANPGTEGHDGTITDPEGASPTTADQEPVTTVNWRDSMVWCNALTEWYNAQNSTSYECVYTYFSTVIRDSRDTNATACDSAVAGSTAKGFRLLSSNEYELAARYRDGTNWTYGDHASGDDSGACSDEEDILGGLEMSTVFGNYAVYIDNSGDSTANVKSKSANALNLYDMSGNVREWCFTLSESDRVYRGGSWWFAGRYLRVGYCIDSYPSLVRSYIGFRFARTAD